eukprot:11395511-Alexandrium_andersonii.AAC.1
MQAVGAGSLDVASLLLDKPLSAVSLRDTSRLSRTALHVLLAAEVYASGVEAASPLGRGPLPGCRLLRSLPWDGPASGTA